MSREQEEGLTRNNRDRGDRRRMDQNDTPETKITAAEEDLSKIEVDDIDIQINGQDIKPEMLGFFEMAFPIDDAGDVQRLNSFLILQMQSGQMTPEKMVQPDSEAETEEQQNENGTSLVITGMHDGEEVVKMETNIQGPDANPANEMSGRGNVPIPGPGQP